MSFPLLFLDQIKLRDFLMISGNFTTYRCPEIVLIFTVIVLTSEKVIYSTYQKQPPEVFCKKKLFLEISPISLENICARDSFLIKLQALGIRVPKVPFRFFEKLKNEIQNSILRFCFYFNKEDEIQITDYHFHV